MMTKRQQVYLAITFLFLGLQLYLCFTGIVTVEKARLLHDRLACWPIRSKNSIAPAPSLPVACDPIVSISERLIYVAKKETRKLWKKSGCAFDKLDEFTALLLDPGTTGIITPTDEPADADVIFIPFPSMCQHSGNRIDFNDFYEATRHLSRTAHLAVVCPRPWMERTNFRMEIYEFFRRYPQIVVFSPEIKNIDHRWSINLSNRFYNHIVIPQFPLAADVYDLSDEEREYRFCFTGTLLNHDRRTTAWLLMQRNDSHVVGTCRSDRPRVSQQLMADAASIYTQCDFCPMPRGDSLSDRRFFDAIRAGCIPIVYEKMRPLPFPQYCDYSFLIYIDNKDMLADEFRWIDAMEDDELFERRARMKQTAAQLSFSACQGYAGLFHAIEMLDNVNNRDSMGYFGL